MTSRYKRDLTTARHYVILRALTEHGYNRKLAANALGISRHSLTNFIRDMRAAGMNIPESKRTGVSLLRTHMQNNGLEFIPPKKKLKKYYSCTKCARLLNASGVCGVCHKKRLLNES